MTKAVVTTLSECDASDFKIASFYDFWSLVHNEGFPSSIVFGKLDSYGMTTHQLVHDIVERDIDSRFMVIPKGYTIDNFSFNDELGQDKDALHEFLECYLKFRTAHVNTTKRAKGSVPAAAIPLQKLD